MVKKGRRIQVIYRVLALVVSALVLNTPVSAGHKPRLILQITVDQLRGDLPTRYYDRLGEGGLKYLLDEGLVYKDAHHAHANTETIVGHATLATGAHPSEHGMIGNIWFDRATGVTTYNIEDSNYTLITEGADVDDSTEIDPTQKAASSDGRSPAAILTTTFADELTTLTDGRAKVIGISVKDRAAVSMAGHAGKAFWFSKSTAEFVTSSYYYEKYPQWVVDWNNKNLPEQYSGKAWELMYAEDTYLFAGKDDQEWEFDLAGYGRTFPHKFGTATDNKYFSTFLTISPAGDELTLDFTRAAIDAEQIGADDVTDFLAVSFSATDYIGHVFGPSSLESEDNILQLDRVLAELFSYIDEKIGLKNTLVVLSADHGSPEAPGYMQSLGIPTGYVTPDSWDKQPAIDRIKAQFRISGKLIEGYDHPYVYLSNEVINNVEIDLLALERAIADELLRFEGVSTAVSSEALIRGAVVDNNLTRAIARNYNRKRSGNVYIVFEPGWFINEFDGLSVSASHGSPYAYDTFVPIIFAGYKIKPGSVSRRVHTIDVAPTLSNIVGANPPSGASGQVLLEVVKH